METNNVAYNTLNITLQKTIERYYSVLKVDYVPLMVTNGLIEILEEKGLYITEIPMDEAMKAPVTLNSSYREVKEAIVSIRKSLQDAKTDRDKLEICRNNELVKIICDNDDTMICFIDGLELDHEEILITSLSEYVGYDDGVFTMFELLNINAESV